MCTTTDCQLGATEALIFVMVGILIALLVYALWPHVGPDEPPGPPPGPNDEDPIAHAITTDELRDDLVDEIDVWMRDHTITEPFEANLLPGGRDEEEDAHRIVAVREPRARFGFWLGVG